MVKSKILELLNQHRLISDPMAITGLSMAAEARRVFDSAEVAKAMSLLGMRYPEYAAIPLPKPEEVLSPMTRRQK